MRYYRRMPPLSPTLRTLARQLDAAGIEDAELEARILLAHVLSVDQAWLIAHGEDELGPDQAARLDALVQARLAGQPVSQLLGVVPFCGLEIRVTRDVLSPRPETEELVERVLERVRHRGALRALDVGTGSGCIALALAKHLPHAQVEACDVSAPALALAAENARALPPAHRPYLFTSDLLHAAEGAYDLVVANLPYLTSAEMRALPVELTYEPALALDGGADGNLLVARLLAELPRHLGVGGAVALELHPRNVDRTLRLAERLLPGARVEAWADLGGVRRFVWADRWEERSREQRSS